MAKARRRDTKHIASAQWHLDQAQQRLDAPSAAAPQRSQSQGHALNAAIGALRDASPRSHAADDVGPAGSPGEDALPARARWHDRWREFMRLLQARSLARALGCLRFQALSYRRARQHGRPGQPPPMLIFLRHPDLLGKDGVVTLYVFHGETVADLLEYALCWLAFCPPAELQVGPPTWSNSGDMKAAVDVHELWGRSVHTYSGAFAALQRAHTLEQCRVVAGATLRLQPQRGLRGGGPCGSKAHVRVADEDGAGVGAHTAAAADGGAPSVEETAVEPFAAVHAPAAPAVEAPAAAPMVEETVGGADGEDAAAAAENERREASGVVTSPGIETTEGAAPLPPAGSVPAQLAAGSANSAPPDPVIGTSADTGSAGASDVASDGSSASAAPLALSPGLQTAAVENTKKNAY